MSQTHVLLQALNDTTQINSQDVFNNMFRSAITQKNPQALREFKKLLYFSTIKIFESLNLKKIIVTVFNESLSKIIFITFCLKHLIVIN